MNQQSPFEAARQAWLGADRVRAVRRRLKRFTYGQQWDDPAVASDGTTVTEREQALMQGRKPVTNNLLRPLVKSVVGRFRHILSQTSGRSGELEELGRLNQLDELDARALEEFLISGCAVQRVCCEHRYGRGFSAWADNVNPDRFFVNRFSDPRGADIRLVGMLHDMTLPELMLRFGHGSASRMERLKRIYTSDLPSSPLLPLIGREEGEVTFTTPSEADLCRVVEVWTFDIRRDGSSRALPHWHCRFYSPDGQLVDHTRSPYPSGCHPFVVKFYPLTDGEIHPFIEDVIDQQRHINSLLSTYEAILANSAKGALMVPVDSLAPGTSLDQLSSLWAHPGAVIPVRPGAKALPTPLRSGGDTQGASNLLDIEMRMFQQISGVAAALSGHITGSNMSASLFENQVSNASIALLDIFETFNAFRFERDRLLLDAAALVKES